MCGIRYILNSCLNMTKTLFVNNGNQSGKLNQDNLTVTLISLIANIDIQIYQFRHKHIFANVLLEDDNSL